MPTSNVSIADIQRKWRVHKKNADPVFSDLTIGVIGSMTVEPIEAYLGIHLMNKGFKYPKIIPGAFGQIHQACHNPKEIFGVSPDVLIILWRLDDIFQNLEAETQQSILNGIDTLISSLKTLSNNFSGTIIVSNPTFPVNPAFDLLDLDGIETMNSIFVHTTNHWNKALQNIEKIQKLDLNALIMSIGMNCVFDRRKWALYHQPWSENFWSLIGTQCGRLICRQTISAKKCIVLDADNTLWGGIIGEDGISGIELGDEFPGSAYRQFQKHILHLQKRGVMLAVASKNNESDFFEVIDHHSAMVLKREHFLDFQVHWNSKVQSILDIAKELNIGTNSIIFIDDNPKEIGEVKSQLTDVTCITVPEEISDLPFIFNGKDYFDQEAVTSEDLHRNQMMKAETSRKTLQTTMTEAEFKASLELEMDIFIAQEQHIARITQLINKTNQFNLTTRRRTQDEIAHICRTKNHSVIGMNLKDKYGDYGLVGVAILAYEGEICTIDTLLLSCRVLGRDAEKVFISGLVTIAQKHGCADFEGEYIASAKNILVKDLYKTHGFTYNKPRSIWTAQAQDIPPAPEHIKMNIID